jgi:DNA polymerase III sliding clamp (beta) subunit (PCNA family)
MATLMRFVITTSELKDMLSQAKQLVSATPSTVAFSGVLLEVKNKQLTIISSDGENTLTIKKDVTQSEPGHILLIPKPLATLLASLPPALLIDCEVLETGDLQVTPAGLSSYTFRPITATFPKYPVPPVGVQPAKFDLFGTGLSLVRHAAGSKDAAVRIQSTKDDLRLYTTDTFRLAFAEIIGAGFGEFSGVLSLAACERAVKLRPFEVTYEGAAHSLTFRNNETTYTTRLLATPFPNVETVLDSAPAAQTALSSVELVAAVSRLASISPTVFFEFLGDKLNITATAAEVGSGAEVINLLSSVPTSFKTQLRVAFLLHAIEAMGEGNIEVAYSGEAQPLFLRSTNPLPTVQVIMPIRA